MTFLPSTRLDQASGAQSFRDADKEMRAARFNTLETHLNGDSGTFWAWMRPGSKPCFTPELLTDILAQQQLLRGALSPSRRERGALAARWYVMGSRIPGIFNLGGDLALFAEKIRAQDEMALRQYGYLCVDAIYGNSEAFQAPVVTVALVQGDALGGGFECALAFDVIVAERSAKFGLPEIMFNLFPGMGAYSFLSRRVGPVQAERMITSGRIYSAEELHLIGLVDVLAEDGHGEEAVLNYINRNDRKHNALQAIYKVRRRSNPVTLAELRDIVEIWSSTALDISEMDLRKMLRLTAAQEKRLAHSQLAAQAAE